MDQGFQMLRANGRQSDHPHPGDARFGRSEITSAIYGDLVARFREPLPEFFVTGFDSAVFRLLLGRQ